MIVTREMIQKFIERIENQPEDRYVYGTALKGVPNEEAIQCAIESGLNVKEYNGYTFISTGDIPQRQVLDAMILIREMSWE